MSKKVKESIAYHSIVLVVLLFVILVYKCPISYFFHIPCPGCGLTRAYFAALILDFKSAFNYHPLFFTVAPTILYAAHRNVMKRRFSSKAEGIYLAILCALFLAVYIFRIYKQLG